MHEHHGAGSAVEAPARIGSALRVGVGGPVGTGKTALVGALCAALRDEWSICVVTNDIFTTADADALRARGVLDADRIVAVETGCCPHTAVRDDVSANLDAVEALEERFRPDLVLIESGGDNLTLTWSRALVDRQIFVLDTAGGDDVPGKGGPGTVQSDLLVVNKTDLAPHVGADLGRMERDARARRGARPLVLTSVRSAGGVDSIVAHLRAWATR